MTMTEWTEDELNQIGSAEEVHISSVRRDGSQSKAVTTWVVRLGDDLYVRSVRGRNGHWFRRVQQAHEGRIRAGGIHRDLTFVDAKEQLDEIDAAYRAKYRRYAGPILSSVLTAEARSATLRLVSQSRC
jgi:hypothetical protein